MTNLGFKGTRAYNFPRSRERWISFLRAQGVTIFLDHEKDEFGFKGTWGHDFSKS
jgi:hypothetical protein